MLQNSPTVNPNFLKEEGNIRIAQLDSIIVTKSGKPDRLAIDIYIEARSWFKPKKSKDTNDDVIYVSKLKGEGWRTSYDYLSKKFKCSKGWVRQKLVLLEKLGLLTRDFKDECINGEIHNDRLHILIWKNTPYFTNNIGLEKPIIVVPPLPLEWHPPSHCSVTPPATRMAPPLPLKCDPIYSNTNNLTNNRTNNNTNKELLGLRTIIGNRQEQEPIVSTEDEPEIKLSQEDADFLAYARELHRTNTDNFIQTISYDNFTDVKALVEKSLKSMKVVPKEAAKVTETTTIPTSIPTSQAKEGREGRGATIEEFEATPRTTTNEFTPKYLRDVKLTSVLLDELRVRSGTDFTNDRIIAIIRNICDYKPDTQIFGGRNALINYLIKALKGEQEYEEQYTTPDDEDAQSIEDRRRAVLEDMAYRRKNGIITWLD